MTVIYQSVAMLLQWWCGQRQLYVTIFQLGFSFHKLGVTSVVVVLLLLAIALVFWTNQKDILGQEFFKKGEEKSPIKIRASASYLLQRTNAVLLKYGDYRHFPTTIMWVTELVSINYSSFEFKTLGVQIVF